DRPNHSVGLCHVVRRSPVRGKYLEVTLGGRSGLAPQIHPLRSRSQLVAAQIHSCECGTRAAAHRAVVVSNHGHVAARDHPPAPRSEEHTSELQSRFDLVCRLLLEKKKTITATE